MKEKMISVTIALLFAASAVVVLMDSSADVAGEEGPSDNWENYRNTTWYSGTGVLIINTPGQFADFAHRSLTNSFAGRTIEIGVSTLDMSAHYWTPIGPITNGFAGTFDGKGVTIKGLYVGTEVYTGPDIRLFGLFGFVGATGTVKNLNIIESEILGGKGYTASVVAYNLGTIINCHNSATVTGAANIGGIVGYNNNNPVENCHNSGTVTGISDVGGIAGTNLGTIKNSYNTATVTGTGSGVGGIAGTIRGGYATIEKCYNSGIITGAECVGGIVGSNAFADINAVLPGGSGTITGRFALIEKCYNTGAIVGTDYVGGIAGISKGASTWIEMCYNVGTVMGTSNTGPIFGKNDGVGSTNYWLNYIGFSDIFPGGLSLTQMVGSTALNKGNMDGFTTADWTPKANESRVRYFPQLNVFVAQGGDIAKDSLISVAFVPATVETPNIASSDNTSVVNGIGGSFTVTATGGSTIVFSLANAPTGVSINPTNGVMTIGAATEVGTYTFTITASNGVSPVATQSFTLKVAAPYVPGDPLITSSDSTSVVNGTGGSFTVTATGDATIVFSLTGAPTGVSINSSTGVMTIASTVAADTYTFTITASNGISTDATQTFTLKVTVSAPGGDNTMLFVAVGAVVAIAALAGVYFLFIRKP